MVEGTQVFVGRQPILNRDREIVAYELLFRASADAQFAQFSKEETNAVSMRVIVNTFMSMGANRVLGENHGYINVTRQVLLSDLIEALPAKKVTIEILEDVRPDPSVIGRCKELRKRGFTLALDDYVGSDPRDAMLGLVDVVKVDLAQVHERDLRRLFWTLRRHPVRVLAEKVETEEQFRRCHELGFDLFQGYFFARAEVVQGASLDPMRSVAMELVQKLLGDAESIEIAELLKRRAELGMNLLRLVNSAAAARPSRIDSVEHAVNFLGRRQLLRWMTILLFAGGDEGGLRGPLVQLSAHRGRLLELLAGQETSQLDRAFFVGMLSLMDVLLRCPKEEIFDELNLDQELRDALLEHEGFLGTLLSLVESLEADDSPQLLPTLAELGLGLDQLQDANNRAYEWVHGLATEGTGGF